MNFRKVTLYLKCIAFMLEEHENTLDLRTKPKNQRRAKARLVKTKKVPGLRRKRAIPDSSSRK